MSTPAAHLGTALCDLLGIEHPIVGFTPSEHVAAAVSRAGGLGVLGCVRFNDPAELDRALGWMDANTGGRPYGINVVMPARVPTEGAARDLDQLIPEGHKDFVEQTLLKLGVPPLPDGAQAADGVLGWLHSIARKHVEVALAHPARLIANALGPPPPDVIQAAHERGMVVAALAGKAEHALRQVASGVDIVVAQGYEAGGHTGEIGSMVLIPEIVDAVGGRAPVLAAGGIGCGRQIVAALALGAAGVWMGSAWLLTQEYAQLTSVPAVTAALLAATSSDTTRSRIYSGKPARLLKNRWTDAWEQPGAPEALPMPLQNLLVSEAHQRLMRSGQPDVVPMPAGQPGHDRDDHGPSHPGAGAEGFARPGARHSRDTFDVVGGPLAIIVDDDAERAADLVRPTLALYIGGMGARGLNFHYEVFARMGYEAQARAIQDFYLAGDKKSAIAAVPAKLVEDVALVGPWAKIADEIQRWKQTVLTTFSVHCELRHLEKLAGLVR